MPSKVKSSIEKAKKAIEKIVRYIEKNIHKEGAWRYPSGIAVDTHKVDLSNTQYAMHFLYEARRTGVTTSTETLIKTLPFLRKSQKKFGYDVVLTRPQEGYAPIKQTLKAKGWAYTPGDIANGSMTTAGLMCMAILKSIYTEDPKLREEKLTIRKIDDSILGGLAWLTKEFRADTNPITGKDWKYYYLYGLEKVSDYLDIKSYDQTLADGRLWVQHWYKEGAEHLLEEQKGTGSWPASNGLTSDLTSTSFAVLFLKRTTKPPKKSILPKAPVTTGDGGKKTAKGSPSK